MDSSDPILFSKDFLEFCDVFHWTCFKLIITNATNHGYPSQYRYLNLSNKYLSKADPNPTESPSNIKIRFNGFEMIASGTLFNFR